VLSFKSIDEYLKKNYKITLRYEIFESIYAVGAELGTLIS